MDVMVTFNVATDIDMANGARGRMVDIVLDPRECANSAVNNRIQLQYPPLYVLVEMKRTKAKTLPGLRAGVLPVTPIYAFTDYRAQAQTLEHCVVDIGTPPTGQLTPFNAYVALSRSRGRDTIRLLRDFDE